MNDLATEIARERVRHLHTFPEGEPIVSMIQFNGHAFVATSQNVYEIKDDKLVRIRLQEVESDARA